MGYILTKVQCSWHSWNLVHDFQLTSTSQWSQLKQNVTRWLCPVSHDTQMTPKLQLCRTHTSHILSPQCPSIPLRLTRWLEVITDRRPLSMYIQYVLVQWTRHRFRPIVSHVQPVPHSYGAILRYITWSPDHYRTLYFACFEFISSYWYLSFIFQRTVSSVAPKRPS